MVDKFKLIKQLLFNREKIASLFAMLYPERKSVSTPTRKVISTHHGSARAPSRRSGGHCGSSGCLGKS